MTFLQADVRALPLDDGAWTSSHASLVLHHLDPADAVAALREMRRVARRGVVVNDLRRGALAFARQRDHGARPQPRAATPATTACSRRDAPTRCTSSTTWRPRPGCGRLAQLPLLPRVTTVYR